MKGKFGIGMYILFLRGSKSSKLGAYLQKNSLYSSGKHQPESWWKGLGLLKQQKSKPNY